MESTHKHAHTESLTWQNILASCLSFPSGQGPKCACSQANPFNPYTTNVSKPVATILGQLSLTLYCHTSFLSCKAEKWGISQLTGCFLKQQHSLDCESPITDGEASSAKWRAIKKKPPLSFRGKTHLLLIDVATDNLCFIL